MLVAFKTLPTLEYDLFTDDGRRGWIGEWFAHENDDSMVPVEKPVKVQFIDETRLFIRYVLSKSLLTPDYLPF